MISTHLGQKENGKFHTLLFSTISTLILFLTACNETVPSLTITASETLAKPTEVASTVSPLTPEPTVTPKPTETATPAPSVDILYENLETCKGFEALCTNPHGVLLTGAAKENWHKLREQKDLEYSNDVLSKLTRTAGEGKWQAEFAKFFPRAVPDITKWDSGLTTSDKLDLTAAYSLAYHDGKTPMNLPSAWIREAVTGRDVLFSPYRVNYQKIGYAGALPQLISPEFYNSMPKYSSFGVNSTIAWLARDDQLGIYGKDYIGPVYYPGKSINDAGLAWVYVRDQNGIPHATFQLLAFAPMNFHNDGARVYPSGPGGINELLPQTTKQASGIFTVTDGQGVDSSVKKMTITPGNAEALWAILAKLRVDGAYLRFYNNTTSGSFIGGLDVIDYIGILAPAGFDTGVTP